MKVYCTFCKHDKISDDCFGGVTWCNIVVGIRKSYRYPERIHLEQQEGNKDNNCKYYFPSLFTRLFRRC